MGQNSHIEWCDHTFNPWEGCTKVSPGCAHCYAEARNQRFAGGANWGKGAPRRRTTEANWRQPLKWNRDASVFRYGGQRPERECEAFGWRPNRPRVFCASLADWLDDEVPIEWTADFLSLVHKCQHLDFLLLTKRPENWDSRLKAARDWHFEHGDRDVCDWISHWRLDKVPPANVWIGTTVENNDVCYKRVLSLVHIPARVRFLSCEPMLSKIEIEWIFDVTGYVSCGGEPECSCQACRDARNWPRAADGFDHVAIDWVICGGESGHGARPMHIDWVRSLRDQCEAAGVPFFFKQWGEWMPRSQLLQTGNMPAAIELAKRPKMPSAVMRRDGGIDESLGEAHTSNDAESAIYLVGKKAAGALLDGREWKQFPEVKP